MTSSSPSLDARTRTECMTSRIMPAGSASGPTMTRQASRLRVSDGGGSKGCRVRLWKTELQKLANELGFPITVCHSPPGTSKWYKIEHRLFSFITLNWRGKPLISHEVIVKLIEATTTTTGLKVRCQLDTNLYPPGIKVSDKDVAQVHIQRHDFHGEWNYTIVPSSQPRTDDAIP